MAPYQAAIADAVGDAELALQAEVSIAAQAQPRQARLMASVALYKARGGGWQPTGVVGVQWSNRALPVSPGARHPC